MHKTNTELAADAQSYLASLLNAYKPIYSPLERKLISIRVRDALLEELGEGEKAVSNVVPIRRW